MAAAAAVVEVALSLLLLAMLPALEKGVGASDGRRAKRKERKRTGGSKWGASSEGRGEEERRLSSTSEAKLRTALEERSIPADGLI